MYDKEHDEITFLLNQGYNIHDRTDDLELKTIYIIQEEDPCTIVNNLKGQEADGGSYLCFLRSTAHWTVNMLRCITLGNECMEMLAIVWQEVYINPSASLLVS